jgi:hypothetical protein
MTKRKIQYWVIPPKASSEFVANMEDVLEVYSRPYDAAFPVVCMDEQPVQLLKETRVPIPASKAHARRVDYEYERSGTACIFMFAEPLSGWRHVRVRPQRTKVDWALEMDELLRTCFGSAQQVTLVFAPAKARSILRRLSRRRIPSLKMLRGETTSWASSCNRKQRGVDWQFTIEDARRKLKSLYPKIIV